jgi:hypothetical protein
LIYIYRRAASEGATELAEALNDAGIPARRTQGGLLREERVRTRLAEGRDRLICWGNVAPVAAPHILNGSVLRSKYQDALVLKQANVPTIEVSQNRPPAQRQARGTLQMEADGIEAYHQDGRGLVLNYDEQSARHTIQQLREWLDAPLPPVAEWLGRRNNHIGGSDLLTPPMNPDFWVRKESINEEYRLHIFRGKSIRAGRKVNRGVRPDGRPSHEWIRSFDAGWIIAYEGFKSSASQREIATNAVKALGLDFGAVDLAQKADGSLFVLEVNRAPGIEGGSIQAYVQAINKWIRGE